MTMDDNAVNKFKLNKSGFRSFFRCHNDNRWNDLNFTSKKHARLMMPEGIIQKDEEAVKNILDKIKEEQRANEYLEKSKLERKN